MATPAPHVPAPHSSAPGSASAASSQASPIQDVSFPEEEQIEGMGDGISWAAAERLLMNHLGAGGISRDTTDNDPYVKMNLRSMAS